MLYYNININISIRKQQYQRLNKLGVHLLSFKQLPYTPDKYLNGLDASGNTFLKTKISLILNISV